MGLRFHVADSLTGKLVGRLDPWLTRWDWTDPLLGESSGTLTLRLPDDPSAVARLRALLTRRIRQVVIEDVPDDDPTGGSFVFAGPIPSRAARPSPGQLTVPIVDWRHWFYAAMLRPGLADGSTGDYIKIDTNAREQGLVMADLMELALQTGGPGAASHPGAPRIVVDLPPDTGIDREVTFRQLSKVGDLLDEVRNRNDGGCDWWTYATRDPADPTKVVIHVAVGWPERGGRPNPVRLEFRQGAGGNVHSYTWPEGAEEPTRVYALGEGEPPEQVWAFDENPDLTDGLDVCWEEVDGPFTGVVKKSTAFDHAEARVEETANPQGEATFTVAAERLPVRSVEPGDRARVILQDGWEDVDVPAARIVSRQVSGGRGEPTVQVLSLDLADFEAPGADDLPGESGVDEEG